MKTKSLIFILSLIVGIFIGAYITILKIEQIKPVIKDIESTILDTLHDRDSIINHLFNDSVKKSIELFTTHFESTIIIERPKIEVYLTCNPPKHCTMYFTNY